MLSKDAFLIKNILSEVNQEKNTFFFETQGIVIKGARNCGYVRM